MKKVLILLIIYAIVHGMENKDNMPTLEEGAPQKNCALMHAISTSNHPAVLSALHNNQDQNYLWSASDDDTYNSYIDLTAVMYALKILRKNNRWECALNVTTALTKDLGNAVIRYAMNSYADQYPVLQYIDPIRQSHTAGLLFGSYQEHPVVNLYKPAKRIARDLLIKENTDLKVTRTVKWHDHPVTVETYLNSMLYSWNPVTRKDGQDLASELGQILRAKQGLTEGGDGFIRREQGIAVMGFGGNHRMVRNPGIYIINNME